MGETAPLRQHGESSSDTPKPVHTQVPSPTSPPAGAPPIPAPAIPVSPIPAQATSPGDASGRHPGRAQHPGPPMPQGFAAVVLSLCLPATVEAVPRARHALRGSMREAIPGEPLDVLELLVSELVTNAVQHSPQSTTVTVEVLRGERTIRISVTDAGVPLPRQRRAKSAAESSADEHGRGLLLVEALAESWGSRSVPGGKVVWCDVDALGV
ncbi:ATP-binding protein [Yinghuangia sp. YIM S09857]|uniref:ATP-binding protein n=1 Tax=Yinghuangia sp. YIM S09857 TaxID=3436929 RepID=UPI003F53C286